MLRPTCDLRAPSVAGLSRAAARTRRTVVLGALAVTVAASGIALSAEFPGIYTFDSLVQLAQAFARRYFDWHPPAMAAWWSVLIRATGTPSALLVFHHALLAGALVALAAFLVREGVGRPALLVGLIPLFPAVASFSGVLWKDVGCAFALALAAALAPWCRRSAAGLAAAAGVALACAYAAAVRVNGIPAIAPIAYAALATAARAEPGKPPRRGRMAALAVALTIAFAALGQLVTYRVLHAERQHIEGYVQLHDLAAIASRTGDDRIPAFARVDPSPGRLREAYQKTMDAGAGRFLFYSEDGRPPPLRLVLTDAEEVTLAKAWLGAIAAHPGAYVVHRARMMAKLLRLGERSPEYWEEPPQEVSDVAPGVGTEVDLQLREALVHDHGAPGVEGRMRAALVQDHAAAPPWRGVARRIVRFLVEELPPPALFLGWPWLLAALAIAATSPLAARSEPALASWSGAIALSGALAAASYFPISHASDFRYLYWLVLSVLLAAMPWAAAVGRAVRRGR